MTSLCPIVCPAALCDHVVARLSVPSCVSAFIGSLLWVETLHTATASGGWFQSHIRLTTVCDRKWHRIVHINSCVNIPPTVALWIRCADVAVGVPVAFVTHWWQWEETVGRGVDVPRSWFGLSAASIVVQDTAGSVSRRIDLDSWGGH